MAKKIDLLGCPHCGSKPKFHFDRDHKPEITKSYWSLGQERGAK